VSDNIGTVADRVASELLTQGTDAKTLEVVKTDSFLILNVHLGRNQKELRVFPIDYSKLPSPEVLKYEGKHADTKYAIDRDGQSPVQLAALDENLRLYEEARKRALAEEAQWDSTAIPESIPGTAYRRWC
jgi:hypothetical protein